MHKNIGIEAMIKREVLQIDPMPHCNLRCPLCITAKQSKKRKSPLMDLADFTKILEQAAPFKFKEVHLFNGGETLLHPQVVEMIQACRQRGLWVSLHSNLNIPKWRLIDAVEAGLNEITASIDGVSQNAYVAYRKKGKVSLALSNLELGARLQTSYPFQITWQYLVNRFNEHELIAARELALSLGVRFTPLPIGVGDDMPDNFLDIDFDAEKENWAARQNLYAVRHEYGGKFGLQENGPPTICGYLSSSVTIHPDLNVGPCCMTIDPASDFGSLKTATLSEVLSNNAFKEAQNLFRHDIPFENRVPYGDQNAVVCARCVTYQNFLSAFTDTKTKKSPKKRNHANVTDTTSYRDRLLEVVQNEQIAAFILPEFEKIEKRVRVVIDAMTAAQQFFTLDSVPKFTTVSHATFLNICNSMLFRLPQYSMLDLPGVAIMLLGTGGFGIESHESDLEFMAYALADSDTVSDIYLPALLGVIFAFNGYVDPWCITNILYREAVASPDMKAIYSHLDAPALINFARKHDQDSVCLLGEAILCGLSGRVVAGSFTAASIVRAQIIKTLQHYEKYTLAVAIAIADTNLEHPTTVKLHYLKLSSAFLKTAVYLKETSTEEALTKAMTDAHLLFKWNPESQDLFSLDKSDDRDFLVNYISNLRLVAQKKLKQIVPSLDAYGVIEELMDPNLRGNT